ncbi:sulfotransferase family protein [Nocardiopsis alba]|uniref:sulfotransferase family protein n=1 Tax=Nocardiopsis alba TaxID=53437 RepID=UPI0035D73A88
MREMVMLKIIGAGLPRTGTKSLSHALERLTGADCYHMGQLLADPARLSDWREAIAGGTPDWEHLLAGHEAVTDWPGSAFWWELSREYPDAIVVLSTRSTPRQWWDSFHGVIQGVQQGYGPGTRSSWNRLYQEARGTRWGEPIGELLRPLLLGDEPDFLVSFRAMLTELQETRLTPDWTDPVAMMDAYERHNERVRELIAPERLVEWRPEQGWGVLCEALGAEVPEADFPRL